MTKTRRAVSRQTTAKQRNYPELIFFTGKGGVGKTTIAASYAVWRANSSSHDRVLLLSTDPAHSLGDVFERKLPQKPVTISSGHDAKVTVHEVDAKSRFNSFLERYREPLLAAIEAGTIFTREEIEPLLSSTLPGMSEMAALLAIDDALSSGKFDCIVVDTAPFGHTLRLFQLPESFQKLLRFLEVASSRDAVLAAHFGGRAPARNPLISEWQELLEALLIDLRRRARLVLVTTPEPFALEESARVADAMRRMRRSLRVQEIVLNRAVTGKSRCRVCDAQHTQLSRAASFLSDVFPRLPLRIAPDPGGPIMGPSRLLQFGQLVFGDRRLGLKRPLPSRALAPRMKTVPWPLPSQQLSITVGKGGVGKTTVSAAMAVRIRDTNPELRVAICSTDPAPSLDDVFDQPVGATLEPISGDRRLLASEIDAPAEFHAWAARMSERIQGALSSSTGGVHVDLSFERELFSALLDVVPPGLDEVFGVLRISELLREKTAGALILDMAPTGHALELLRTPDRILHWSRLLLKTLALHRRLPFARDVGAEIAKFSSDVRWLARRLRSKQATGAWVVALAEPLPDRETARLVQGLRTLGIPLTGMIVNRVLLRKNNNCARCRTHAAWQRASLANLRKGVSQNIAVYCIEEQADAISGRAALQEFSKQLWRLS